MRSESLVILYNGVFYTSDKLFERRLGCCSECGYVDNLLVCNQRCTRCGKKFLVIRDKHRPEAYQPIIPDQKQVTEILAEDIINYIHQRGYYAVSISVYDGLLIVKRRKTDQDGYTAVRKIKKAAP